MNLPVISWATAASWKTNRALLIGEAIGWRNTTANISEYGFALEVTDDRYAFIPKGSFIFVEPSEDPPTNSIVIASLKDRPAPILKRLVIDGPHRYLNALNSEYKPFEIDDTCIFIGIVKQIVVDL